MTWAIVCARCNKKLPTNQIVVMLDNDADGSLWVYTEEQFKKMEREALAHIKKSNQKNPAGSHYHDGR
jgi:DNA-binding transcriptional regulator/RsmH inhibitor MraZ